MISAKPRTILVVDTPAQERSMRALDLALRIADHEVQRIIRLRCDGALADGEQWLDLRFAGDSEEDKIQVDRAVRYIGLRHADAFPWRFIHHPDRPELVRFEERT